MVFLQILSICRLILEISNMQILEWFKNKKQSNGFLKLIFDMEVLTLPELPESLLIFTFMILSLYANIYLI